MIPKAAEVPTRISVLIPTTSIEEAIVDEAVHLACDLIIVGTHGRSGLPRMLLGSVAEGVARRSSVPVMLVPAVPMEDDKSAKVGESTAASHAPVYPVA